MRKISGRPIRPARISRSSRAKFGSKRRLNATINGTPAFLRHGGTSGRAAAVEIERLLAEDRLAGAGRRFDQIGMGVGRAGDQDRIDGRVGQRFRLIAQNRAVPSRQPFRRCPVCLDDRVQSRLGMGGDVSSMDRADAPGTELAEADHARAFDYSPNVTQSRAWGSRMTTIRLTMAQALIRYLAAQTSEVDGREVPLFAGVFAIFGHGNVAGVGEALYDARERLPTLRAHNEQAMAPGGDRLCQGEPTAPHDGLHELDRPGRNEHGDRGGGRACQPPAGAALARRRLRRAGGPIRCCSRSRRSATRPSRSMIAFGRSRAGGTASRGPEQILESLPQAIARADRPGRVRAGDAGLAAGRTDRGLRLSRKHSLPRVAGSCAARRPIRLSSPKPQQHDRAQRRR